MRPERRRYPHRKADARAEWRAGQGMWRPCGQDSSPRPCSRGCSCPPQSAQCCSRAHLCRPEQTAALRGLDSVVTRLKSMKRCIRSGQWPGMTASIPCFSARARISSVKNLSAANPSIGAIARVQSAVTHCATKALTGMPCASAARCAISC